MQGGLETADERFLQLLQQQGATTISSLCDLAGVTPTAIRQRLRRLEAAGYIDREVRRIGRGRPQHVFRLTSKGVRQLGDNYTELALLLWDELHAIEDHTVRDAVLDRVRTRLTVRYSEGVIAGGLRQKFDQLGRILTERGFRVEIQQQGLLPVLRETACPYKDLADHDHSVCEMEQSVYESVLGVPLTLTRCCREGDVCCEFQPAPEKGLPEPVS